MLRDWTGDWIGTFMGERRFVIIYRRSTSPDSLQVIREQYGAPNFHLTPPKPSREVQTSRREFHPFFSLLIYFLQLCSKVWDTYSGQVIHSFPHDHIVRTVDIAPSCTQIVTGDQTKKIRIFDLSRPDADPRYLTAKDSETAHEKTVKSVVWLPEGSQIVSGGEDGVVKLVYTLYYPFPSH
jgi:serine-threonine kinase receptor-associated protein